MSNEAVKLDRDVVLQEAGTVARCDGDAFLVRTSHGSYRARRAVSCLVEPIVGDEVIVAVRSSGRGYVLAVLEREPGQKMRIKSDGDVELSVDGRFSVQADDGVELSSRREVSVLTREVKVNALDASVVFQRLTYLGKYLQSEVEKVKSIAGSVDMVLDRFSQRARSSLRTVGYDRVQAEQIDYKSEGSLNLRSETAVMTAKGLVKVDGAQIHVG